MQDPGRRRLRRAEIAGHDGGEGVGGQEFGQEVCDGGVEVAGADSFGERLGV